MPDACLQVFTRISSLNFPNNSMKYVYILPTFYKQ